MIVLNGSWKEEITEAFGEGKAIRTMFLKPTDKEVYKRDAFLEKRPPDFSDYKWTP